VRIESVTAVAFGPFKGDKLELSPKLTVIYGPNEAGKSSWHAAFYAALCGLRRGPGKRKVEREFAERRKPWAGDEWQVNAVVRLDGGRRIELRQNLADLAHCTAIDADLGRDVASEILNEGTPDAARWLGLDRSSFLSVACVNQGDIQAIADDAASLQDELQRATASAAQQATAARAIEDLEAFLREHVGLDRSNSTRPLARAKARAHAAEEALLRAWDAHQEWLAVQERALEFSRRAAAAAKELRVARAQAAVLERDRCRTRLSEAQRLSEKYPVAPSPLPEDADPADRVAGLLSEWESLPPLQQVAGMSSAEIRAMLAALPDSPEGDLAVADVVAKAREDYQHAIQALMAHESQRPADFPKAHPKGLSSARLRQLADTIEASIPPIDTALRARLDDVKSRVDRASHGFVPLVIAVAGSAAVLGGVASWINGFMPAGLALIAIGLALFIWAMLRGGPSQREQALQELHVIEAQLEVQRQAAESARHCIAGARRELAKAGLAPDAAALRTLADELVLVEERRSVASKWLAREKELEQEIADGEQRFRQSLVERGVADVQKVETAFRRYEADCRSRAAEAVEASRREDLQGRLEARIIAEQAANDSSERHQAVRSALLTTAGECGTGTDDADTAASALREWQSARRDRIAGFDAATREYAQLEALLDVDSIEQMTERVKGLDECIRAAAAELGAETIEAASPDVESTIPKLEAAAREADVEAARAQEQALERARLLESVAEAEEAVKQADEELQRVTGLESTLRITLEYLRAAEERVHRDIAPQLAAGLKRWLPAVTSSRYTDARVDPATLVVTVLGPDGEWTEARLLSHGTAEQVYLLLRGVLAERLVTTGETCPLLLDDVLVQSDRVRKRALLETIREISRTRQVILFTQEDEVLDWAHQALTADDRLVQLAQPVAAVAVSAR
jgi:hypothetical protein